jgi:3-dehydroquinate synthase
MSETVQVDLGETRYDIRIGSGVLPATDWEDAPSVLLVSDANVAPLHGERIRAHFAGAGLRVEHVVVPAGETSKSTDAAHQIYDGALAAGLDRRGIIVALGGGVVGDLAGYAAATFLRGIRYVQVPTTLLAMVDSSVGGKTGINLAQGKNLVGVFHQPIEVVADLDMLVTLPAREYVAGLAEVIKYGVIWDKALLDLLEKNVDQLLARDGALLAGIVARCCAIKAEVVARDEREHDLRAILNFGHTLGHAIENAGRYAGPLHGEAIAVGMVYAARLSVRHADLPLPDFDRLRALITAVGLPVSLSALPSSGGAQQWSVLRAAMTVDKKSVAGRPRFVLATELGAARPGYELPDDALEETFNALD